MIASRVNLSRGLAEFLANIGRGLAVDAHDMIGAVFLRDGKLVGIACKSDDRRTASEELGVLDGVPA